ncbi:MAG TPA: polysaccharide deacetylase family protein [Rhodanobacteraceae bacterium]|jgi:peptidoglycan/xylan/chitin deacetylase (PgdA/CDA1 family)|nr:polysaccharide deacetylase family protein [Rhodanobacteraceae bacterium]
MADAALPILMYHGLHAGPGDSGVYDAVYSVEPRDFAAQLDWLAANGYRTARLRDLQLQRPDSARNVMITFDDGDISNLQVALPELSKRRMVAEFFVTADFVGRPGRLAPQDLRTLADAGMSVQAHGCSHRYLDELSLAEVEEELSASKQRLEAILGQSVTALALPGGRGGERERALALGMGYLDVLGSVPGRNRQWSRGRYLQRLAVTRGLALEDFASMVRGRGALPALMQARYHVLALTKRLLGNRRYEHFRTWMLDR